MNANSDDNSIKKEKKAVALRYDQERDAAPTLAAKGKNWLAEKIIEIAKDNDIPITKDENLVELLEKTELEEEIPMEVYAVVAEIFAWVYRLNNKQKQSRV